MKRKINLYIRLWRFKFYKFMHNESLKRKLYDIIFEAETPIGKMFDSLLMLAIILSILLIILESIEELGVMFSSFLRVMEYVFTVFFTIEYVARLYCSPRPMKYATSFFGVVDLLSTLPVYITWIFGSARYLLIIRAFRLIRVFRVFKLFDFLDEGHALLYSLKASSRKIMVFFLFVMILVIALGTAMYMVEGNLPDTQFNNIPNSIYWAIVTLTTVGYGDITPVTHMGRFLSSIVMLMGYTIIAVPTGIVSASIFEYSHKVLGSEKREENEHGEEDEAGKEVAVDEINPDDPMAWKLLKRTTLMRKKWLTAYKDHVKLPTGVEMKDYYVLDYPDWINVIAITEVGEFVMVKQHRHGIQKTLIELCGGVIEDGEDPLVAARRELLEETGYGSGEWDLLMTIAPNAGTCNNMCYCFVAKGVELMSSQHLDKTEDIKVMLMEESEVRKLLEEDGIAQSLMEAPLWKYFATKPTEDTHHQRQKE